MRLLFLLSALCILCASAIAQLPNKQTCRVKVRIVNFAWGNPESRQFDKLSTNQLDWWLKEGQKKFPGVCITSTPNEADFAIAWTETVEERTGSYTAPKTETTQHSGTVNATSTSTAGSVYTSGTYDGTSRKTTYEDQKYEWSIGHVNAFVYKVIEEAGSRRSEKIPMFIAKHKGQWRWSKPDKDAMEKSMKFIAGEVK